jgi:hypothetical protein
MDPDPLPRFDRDPSVLEHMNAAYRRYKDRSCLQEEVAEHHPRGLVFRRRRFPQGTKMGMG